MENEQISELELLGSVLKHH